MIAIGFVMFYRKHSSLSVLHDKIALSLEGLPMPKNIIECDYTVLLKNLYSAK